MFLENVLWGEDCIRCFYLEHGFKKKQPSTHTAQQALQTCSQSVAPTLAAAAAAGVGGGGGGVRNADAQAPNQKLGGLSPGSGGLSSPRWGRGGRSLRF